MLFEARTCRRLRTIAGPELEPTYARAQARAAKAGDAFGAADPIAHAIGSASFQILRATTEIACSPDSRLIAVAGPSDPEAAIRLYEVAIGRPRATVVGSPAQLFGGVMGYSEGLQFDAGGRHLAALTTGSAVLIVDVAKGVLQRELAASRTNTIMMTRDGRVLVTGHADGAMSLWCIESRRLAIPLRQHRGTIQHLRFDATKTSFASTSDDGTSAQWRLSDPEDVCAGRGRGDEVFERLRRMRPLTVLEEHGGIAWRLAFLAGGDRLLTTSPDGTVRLWDATKAGVDALPRPAKGGLEAARVAHGAAIDVGRRPVCSDGRR